MDWDNDPEARALREEFVSSFAARADELGRSLGAGDFEAVQAASHRLGGAAESYGFPSLTRAASAIDDYLSLRPPGPADDIALGEFVSLLVEMLSAAAASKADPTDYVADARFGRLTSAAESLLSAAKP